MIVLMMMMLIIMVGGMSMVILHADNDNADDDDADDDDGGDVNGNLTCGWCSALYLSSFSLLTLRSECITPSSSSSPS